MGTDYFQKHSLGSCALDKATVAETDESYRFAATLAITTRLKGGSEDGTGLRAIGESPPHFSVS